MKTWHWIALSVALLIAAFYVAQAQGIRAYKLGFTDGEKGQARANWFTMRSPWAAAYHRGQVDAQAGRNSNP